MMRLCKSLIVLMSIGIGAVQANDFITSANDFSVFTGADFEYSLIKATGDWDRVVSKVYSGGNGFVGFRLSEYIAFEIGYEFTGKKDKVHDFVLGETFFSLPNSSFIGTSTLVQTSINGWHIDLLGFIPLDHCIDLFVIVGYGAMKLKSQFGAVKGPFPLLNNAILSINSKGRTFLRLGGGIQWMVTDMTGVRALLRWQNTNRFTITGNNNFNAILVANNVSRNIYKDAVTAAVGVFFRFY